jgi:hypothetical protein
MELAAFFLAMFAVMPAQAQPQATGARSGHSPAFRPPSGGTHFIARVGNRFYPRFHYGNGGVVIFDPLDYGSYYDLPDDDTVYQGQVAPQNSESLPYATPTSDPDIVISPYQPHAAINIVGIPQACDRESGNEMFLALTWAVGGQRGPITLRMSTDPACDSL